MIDRSAEQRNPGLIQRWRETYGEGSVKVCASHAKIATIENADWKLLCRGSMNLNYNPRFEQMDITEGGEDFDLVKRVEEELPTLPPMCSSSDSRIASKLDFAFEMTELKPLESMKTWQK
ncbi:hypothetical protein [Allorhodopirellula heiligendammensis]|nr:hypothetical protein [Allorhodopirellula heiligendammensis]